MVFAAVVECDSDMRITSLGSVLVVLAPVGGRDSAMRAPKADDNDERNTVGMVDGPGASDSDVLNAAAFDREVMARGKNEANGAV